MSAAYVVVDIETTGLDPLVDQVWEIAAERYDADGVFERGYTALVRHDEGLAHERIPGKFLDDYCARYRRGASWSPDVHAAMLRDLFHDAPAMVGASVHFDAAFLAILLGGETPWNHRLRCVTTMASGYLGMDAGGLSDTLDLLGLEPNPAAHTAQADMMAAARIYHYLTGNER